MGRPPTCSSSLLNLTHAQSCPTRSQNGSAAIVASMPNVDLGSSRFARGLQTTDVERVVQARPPVCKHVHVDFKHAQLWTMRSQMELMGRCSKSAFSPVPCRFEARLQAGNIERVGMGRLPTCSRSLLNLTHAQSCPTRSQKGSAGIVLNMTDVTMAAAYLREGSRPQMLSALCKQGFQSASMSVWT